MSCACEDARSSVLADVLSDSAFSSLIMDFSQPFSVLNERLRPRFTTSDQLYSSLSRVEGRQMGSLRSRSASYRPTILPKQPEPKVSVTPTEPEDPEEPENDEEDLASDGLEEGSCAGLMSINNSYLISKLHLKDEGEEDPVDEDSSSLQSEEKDSPDELSSEGTSDASEPRALSSKHGSSFQRSYLDGTLPDLIKSGRPLGRRRTLGHVSDTLEEVRRQVALSRRQSIKLKAQVDKLQESRDGPGWSQHRERVTEEVRSILRLLHPLTEPESSLPEPTEGENHLDVALTQLQSVARKLAISHTKQDSQGEDDRAVLQQALRDRDEAIEKKKAMEAELLRSKTEMMGLNNQLLEAVQKRLEVSLELEAWKEDLQHMLQQQLQNQQLAEQAQKKSSRLGILRRNNKPPIQRPANFPLPTPTHPTTNSNQIYVSRPTASTAPSPSTPPGTIAHRNWRDKLRRGKSSRQGDLEAECGRDDDGFQVVSLD